MTITNGEIFRDRPGVIQKGYANTIEEQAGKDEGSPQRTALKSSGCEARSKQWQQHGIDIESRSVTL